MSATHAQTFASMEFAYQNTTTTPLSNVSGSSGTQGDVEVKWYAGDNSTTATSYYDFIQLYDNGQTPTIDDTWAWDLQYTHTISGSATNGVVNSYGSSNGSYTPNQSTGGNWTNVEWKAIYAGSSSAGSFNGARNTRFTQWLANTSTNTNGTATAKSLGDQEYVVRITKSGQTTIYTEYTHGTVSCTATRGGGGEP